MARVWVCDECGGAGMHPYERGPAAERCPRCRGAGVLFGDDRTAARDFFATMTGTTGSELAALDQGAVVRALAGLTAALEARCEQLEREVARLR